MSVHESILGGGYNVENGLKEMSSFNEWLQCYQNPNMSNLTDRHKRTVWFHGEPGPLVPKSNLSYQILEFPSCYY